MSRVTEFFFHHAREKEIGERRMEENFFNSLHFYVCLHEGAMVYEAKKY